MSVTSKPTKRLKRRRRVRAKIRGTADRPRLSVFRSNKGVFVQLVDDINGKTVAAASWIEPEFRSLQSMEQAKAIGQAIARRAKEAGVESCVFDRGGYQYHGRVAALAEGAREGGLAF